MLLSITVETLFSLHSWAALLHEFTSSTNKDKKIGLKHIYKGKYMQHKEITSIFNFDINVFMHRHATIVNKVNI